MNPETPIQQKILLKIGGRKDCRFFRNNVGVAYRKDGIPVKFGVCNPGGSDLIGWRSVKITPDMVGHTVAVFSAVEVKRPGKKTTKPQNNFIKIVKNAGGISGVAHDEDEANCIIDGF